MQPPRKESLPIFESVGTSPAGEAHATGSMPGEGTYFCLLCGVQLALHETDPLPECPQCGTTRFRRDSIFASLQEHGSATVEFALPSEREPPEWLDEARERLTERGFHLALRERNEIVTFSLGNDWSRIGRCTTAEIFLDDPSVSRRHAMIATESDKPPRVLDDRSLNGVLVNGRKVDWAELEAGDELTIGRYRLHLLQV
ncbi:MAG TPA: FHA domain-containing protein [Solirubrobacterales bacterium]|nr:FHA domain-containing protein [Solirubrobacterales bacterium]